jgi:hypothetical protein
VKRHQRGGSVPDAPVNVRVMAGDGTVYPVELAYRGMDDRGFALWEATTIIPIRWVEGEDYKLLADEIPPRTSISIRGERA